jgi:tetratricopeptide (TPR) repeat protein
MRYALASTLAAAFTLLGATAATPQHQHGVTANTPYQCGPPPPLTATTVPLWAGVDSTVEPGFTLTTHGSQQDSVRAYFNQGLAWMYGYNFGEAVLSFRKAARFDPECALCFWGVATALGANINEPTIAQRWKMAAAETDTAFRRMGTGGASPIERALIASAAARFLPLPSNVETMPADSFRKRRQVMDQRYAAALQAIRLRNPTNATVGTLAAEAQLNLHPWDWWNNDGTAKWPATDSAVAFAGAVLRQQPRHVGAAHIWIHALEASQRPDSAYPQAVFLDSLMPGSAHLTHMPSHIFHRVGEYRRGVEHNQQATAMDLRYLNFRGWEWRYPMYYAHDNDFLWISATLVGMRDDATTSADSLMKIMSQQLLDCYGNAQHFLTAPSLVAMRFGDWERVLHIPSPYLTYRVAYPRGIWHFTRGWAYLRQGDIAHAQASLDSVYRIARSVGLAHDSVVNNSAEELLLIAGQTLSGEIKAAQRNYDQAIPLLRAAVQRQDALNYDEPPAFFYPARHSLGAVLLMRGTPDDLAEAEAVYRTDLGLNDGARFPVNRNRQNGWAYRGMVNTMLAMRKNTTEWTQDFVRVWEPGTPIPPGSRY